EDPAALLSSAASRMAQVRRFHFLLEHENGTTQIALGLQMTRAEGDVDGTDRMKAAVKGAFGSVTIDSGVVVIGEQAWLLNPLSRRWEQQPLSIQQILDPQRGVLA